MIDASEEGEDPRCINIIHVFVFLLYPHSSVNYTVNNRVSV